MVSISASLKTRRSAERRDFAGEILPHTKMLCTPRDALRHADQPGSYSSGRDGLLPVMHVAREMNLYTSGEVKAPLNGRVYRCNLFESNHPFSDFRVEPKEDHSKTQARDNASGPEEGDHRQIVRTPQDGI
jgi:hypothetical protein